MRGALAFAISVVLLGQAAAQTALEAASYTGPDRTERLLAAARKEGSLTLYSPTPGEYMKLLTDAFEKKYGVKVNVWRGLSEHILQRAMLEARSGRNVADVIQNLAVSMEEMHRRNLLLPVASPMAKDLIPDAMPPHKDWMPTLHYVYAQAYNTARVKKEELPKTYADLLDPRWKGRLGIEAGDYDWFDEVVQQMGGGRKGQQFFCDLVTKNGLSVRSGHTLLTNLVASGEVPLALTLYQYSPAQAKAKGAPIDWFVIEPAIAITDGIGVAKNAPHPNAAILFSDFMLSAEGQSSRAKIGYVPASTKVESPMKGIPIKRLQAAALLETANQGQKLFEDTVVTRSACR
jgi:iron(III) transport system substrate-binding protein